MGIKTKSLVEIDKEGNILNYHSSVKDAAAFNNLNSGSISMVCNGYIKHHKGKIWRFASVAETKKFTKFINKAAFTDSSKGLPLEEEIKIDIPDLPVETIPATGITMDDTRLSNFERMLKRKQ